MNVNFICPTCKDSKKIAIPKYKIAHLITVSIPKGMVCEHHFQAFIDKNYKIRGYQKVDIDLKEQVIESKDFQQKKSNQEISKTLKIDGNNIKYDHKNHVSSNQGSLEGDNKKILSLKDIYNEFWEFIDNDNVLFANFIKNDKRRTLNEIRVDNMKIKDFISNLENEILSDNS